MVAYNRTEKRKRLLEDDIQPLMLWLTGLLLVWTPLWRKGAPGRAGERIPRCALLLNRAAKGAGDSATSNWVQVSWAVVPFHCVPSVWQSQLKKFPRPANLTPYSCPATCAPALALIKLSVGLLSHWITKSIRSGIIFNVDLSDTVHIKLINSCTSATSRIRNWWWRRKELPG